MTRNGTRGYWSIVTGARTSNTDPGSGDLDPGPLARGPGSAIRDRAGVQLPADPGPLPADLGARAGVQWPRSATRIPAIKVN